MRLPLKKSRHETLAILARRGEPRLFLYFTRSGLSAKS